MGKNQSEGLIHAAKNETNEKQASKNQEATRQMIPAQFYIALLAIGVYLWPWQFNLMGTDADYLLTCITLQLAIVCACSFVRERWALAVIIIEATSMAFNIAVYLIPHTFYDYHSAFMLCALAAELLIITISLRRAGSGRTTHYRLRMAGSGLWAVRNNSLHCSGCAEANQ